MADRPQPFLGSRVVIDPGPNATISYQGRRGTVVRCYGVVVGVVEGPFFAYDVMIDGFDRSSHFLVNSVRLLPPLEALAEAAE